MKDLFMQGAIAPVVGKTGKYIETLVRHYFLEHNVPLTKEQFIVLWRLEKEPQQQSFLAMITERDKGSLTRLVQSLEKKRYVKRRICDHDSRALWVEITDKGRDVLERTKPLLTKVFNIVEQGISAEKIEMASKTMLEIQENVIRELEEIEQSS